MLHALQLVIPHLVIVDLLVVEIEVLLLLLDGWLVLDYGIVVALWNLLLSWLKNIEDLVHHGLVTEVGWILLDIFLEALVLLPIRGQPNLLAAVVHSHESILNKARDDLLLDMVELLVLLPHL